jgi:hypothetical protein
MYVYSKWILTHGSRRYLEAFAESVGNEGSDRVDLDDARVIIRWMKYEDPQESRWAESVTSGVWNIGIVDFELHDGLGSQLVGVVTPSVSLTEHLSADLADTLRAEEADQEPVIFSFRRMLESSKLHPFSVRLTDDSTRILVQSADTKALLETVAALPGDPAGVTLSIDEGQVSVSDQGAVVFADSTSPTGVLNSMRLIAQESASINDWA